MFVNICLVYNSNNLLSKNFLGFLFVYFFLLNSIQMCQKAQKRPPNTINLPTCMFAKIYISRPRMLSATPAETPPKNNGDNINNNNIPQLLLISTSNAVICLPQLLSKNSKKKYQASTAGTIYCCSCSCCCFTFVFPYLFYRDCLLCSYCHEKASCTPIRPACHSYIALQCETKDLSNELDRLYFCHCMSVPSMHP